MTESSVTLTVDGREVIAPAGRSIIEAIWHAGYPLVEQVGCLGQGVCGSCRAMVRRAGETEVEMLLACETVIADGMRVSFVPLLEPPRDHPYRIKHFTDTWQVTRYVRETFPEAAHCRHCGGCDAACPRGIEVQKGVNLIAAGDFGAAIPLFETCVMCDFCTLACPENIAPNHLGLFARRLAAALVVRPANLLQRLNQFAQGELTIADPELTAAPQREAHHD